MNQACENGRSLAQTQNQLGRWAVKLPSPKLWLMRAFNTQWSLPALDAAVYVGMVEDNGVGLCVFAGHGFLPGGASPAGDPRPAASLLHQPGRAASPGAQELRHEERRPGQVR